MDSFSKTMDFPVTHWAAFPRRFPAIFPVTTAAYLPGKDHWIRRTFQSCNFSIILRGGGEFHWKGKVWQVEAPCVITQWPGEMVEYGPSAQSETWDEIYLIYEKFLFSPLKKAGLIDPAMPVWRIHDFSAVVSQVRELSAISQASQPDSMADRFDRICERLLLETLLKPTSDIANPVEKVIKELSKNPAGNFDLRNISSRLGLSESSFRRRWAEMMPTPPHRYILELRIQKSCRMLAETRHSIYEIAHLCGFEDELYFSRRFRLHMKMAPRDYRKIYQIGGTA